MPRDNSPHYPPAPDAGPTLEQREENALFDQRGQCAACSKCIQDERGLIVAWFQLTNDGYALCRSCYHEHTHGM